MRRAIRISVGIIAGFSTVAVYVLVMRSIGAVVVEKYGEGDLGHTPEPTAAFVCAAWLGLPIAIFFAVKLGVRIGRYSRRDSDT
jgi:hypothetical protein